MDIKEELTCTYCSEILKEPITLNCCGENICKEHLRLLLSNESSNVISCPCCNSDIEKQGLQVNKLIQKLIEKELHKFKIDPKFKELIRTFNTEIRALEKIVNEPEDLIYETLSEVKRMVDLDREKAKAQIDHLANEIIQRLDNYESEFKLNCKSKLVEFNSFIAECKRQLCENEKYINLFSIDNSDREDKGVQTEMIIRNLVFKRNKLENDLFCQLKFNYHQSHWNIDDYFGKLKVSVINSAETSFCSYFF